MSGWEVRCPCGHKVWYSDRSKHWADREAEKHSRIAGHAATVVSSDLTDAALQPDAREDPKE